MVREGGPSTSLPAKTLVDAPPSRGMTREKWQYLQCSSFCHEIPPPPRPFQDPAPHHPWCLGIVLRAADPLVPVDRPAPAHRDHPAAAALLADLDHRGLEHDLEQLADGLLPPELDCGGAGEGRHRPAVGGPGGFRAGAGSGSTSRGYWGLHPF